MNWGYINFNCRINEKYGHHEDIYSVRYWKFFLSGVSSNVV